MIKFIVNKLLSFLLISILIVGLFPITSFAEGEEITVVIDGEVVVFPDAQPTIIDGRTLVPISAVAKALGADIVWNGETQKVLLKLEDVIVTLQVDSTLATRNSSELEMSVPPQIVSGRTLVPLRVISEAFGSRVSWIGDTKTIDIISGNRSIAITEFKGIVEYRLPSSELYDWRAAILGDKLLEKSIIRTGADSSVQLTLADGSSVLLESNTTLAVNELTYDTVDNKRKTIFEVLDGKVWASVVKQAKGSEFHIKSGEKTITSIGTQFGVSKKKVSVISGSVVSHEGGKKTPISTGTEQDEFGDVVLRPQALIDSDDVKQWSSKKLEETQTRIADSQLAMINLMDNAPPNDPIFKEVENELKVIQERGMWNQYEMRQNIPITGLQPDDAIQEMFVNSQGAIIDYMNNSLDGIDDEGKKILLQNQQGIMEQFRQTLTTTQSNNAIKSDNLKKLIELSGNFESNIPDDFILPAEYFPVIVIPDDADLVNIKIPEFMKLPPGMVLPPGLVIDENFELPEGVMIQPGFVLPEGMVLPPNSVIPPEFKFPDNFKIPEGAILPADFVVEAGMVLPKDVFISRGFIPPSNFYIPEGASLPPGFDLTDDMKLPETFVLPPGVGIPDGFVMPEHVTFTDKPYKELFVNLNFETAGDYIPPAGFIPPEGWMPPEGWSPDPDNPNAPPPGWVSINSTIPKDSFFDVKVGEMTAKGGFIPPNGFVPPEGFIPPVGWMPPVDWTPDSGKLPPEWHLVPGEYANIDPALQGEFEKGVHNVFNNDIGFHEDFKLPAGVLPPSDFIPPANWQPPEGFKPPVGWEKPETWQMPENWQPPEGYSLGDHSPVDGDWLRDERGELLPPDNFIPPEWWTAPEGWVEGDPLPEGSAPWQQTSFRVDEKPPEGWVPPEGFVPPVDWEAPNGWVPPETWKPHDGFIPPQGWIPPENDNFFYPKEGFVPPEGFEPPKGFVPPEGFIPPEGFVPPEGYIPPNGHIPPNGYIPPDGTVPPNGYFPPDGYIPPDGIVPPNGYFPPDGYIPPDGTVPPNGYFPPDGYIPPDGKVPPDGYQPPPDGGYQPPPDGGHEPPPDGGYQPPPDGGNVPPPDGGHEPPPDGGYQPPPDGGYQPPPDGGYQPPPDGGNEPPPDGGHEPPPDGGNEPPPDGGSEPPSTVIRTFEELIPLGSIDFEKPYISGYSDNTFKPKKSITRAEVATIFASALELNIDNPGNQKYLDVTSSHWAYNYIQLLDGTGLLSGFEDGTFKPEAPMTRAEIAQVIYNYWLYKGVEVNIAPQETGVDDHWAINAINSLYNYGLHTVFTENSFQPEITLLREEAIALINRLMGRIPYLEGDAVFDDVDISNRFYGDIQAATRAGVKTQE
ncbi:MAG: S-layer homology domain-containing protein [Clostridiales bacterium]|nr:S-layer homology domain-containing protein [Clostridiales bacterium]